MLFHHPPASPSFYSLLLIISGFLPPSLSSPASAPSHSLLRWTSPHDPCYHLDGRPRHCLSEFINAAYGVPVLASDPPSRGGLNRNVSSLTDLHNPHNLTCLSGEPWEGDWAITIPLGRRFEITYISLQFCQQVELSEGQSISILKSMDHGHTWRPLQYYSSDCPGVFSQPAQTVALNRHQETEPLCSDPRPLQKHRGGAVLAFSTLDGRPSAADLDFSPVLQDWVTATDIRVLFHKPVSRAAEQKRESGGRATDGVTGGGVLRWRAGTKAESDTPVEIPRGDGLLWGMMEEKEILKMEGEGLKNRRGGEATSKASRRNGGNKSRSQEDTQNTTRKEGETVTTDTPTSSKKVRGRGRKKESQHWTPCQDGRCDWTVEGQGRSPKGHELRRRRNHGERRGSTSRQRARDLLQRLPPSSLSAPQSRPPISLSDLQVGGRCKCNGHASRCRRDNQGQAVCQCEHHTAGPDCDVCKPFYYDRPWQRATPSQPHPCVPCECNGHSTKCRFSMELYQQSGRQSGGVCLKCRHHTTGRHCQLCQNGYTRDHSKALAHRKTCQPCQCHPLGAVGHWCNQSTGQCLCREGVTGPKCNRCAPGYKQGRSPLRPCLKIQETVAPTPVYQPQYSRAEECQNYCHPSSLKVKMNLETFCLKDYVLKVQVKGMERSGPWWQFSIWVQSVFRVGSSRVHRGKQALWVPDRDLGCGCPALQVGRSFLLIGAEEGARDWAPGEQRLVADRSTLALHWREHWSPKLRGFRGQDKKGTCLEIARENSTARRSHGNARVEEYTPPHLEPPQQEHTQRPPQPTDPQRAGDDTHTATQQETLTRATPHHHTHKHKNNGRQRHGHHAGRSGPHNNREKTADSPQQRTSVLSGHGGLLPPTSGSSDNQGHLLSTACPTLPTYGKLV